MKYTNAYLYIASFCDKIKWFSLRIPIAPTFIKHGCYEQTKTLDALSNFLSEIRTQGMKIQNVMFNE